MSTELIKEDKAWMPLNRLNFILMAIAGAVIILGFILMSGGENNGDEFNPEIFSARRVVVGPTVTFSGFIFMGFAIMYKRRNKTPKA